MGKYEDLLEKYNCEISEEEVKVRLSEIQTSVVDDLPSVYKTCFGLIDLTSLNVTDKVEDIQNLVSKVNHFEDVYPDMPNVAAICVYPQMVPVVAESLVEPVEIASVAGGFPASQTFIEVKVAETAMVVMEGANEVDVVMPVGKFLEHNYQELFEDLSEIKSACREARLKVILETGSLSNASQIMKASVLSMASGADFIKTSTGKIAVGATPEAAYVMCIAIKKWYENTGHKVGFKASGGIVTVDDALLYFKIVKSVLGDEWLNKDLFRFGASKLANNLLSEIYHVQQAYF